MSRTITAFFDTRAEADAARERLSQSSIEADRVRIVDQSHTGSGAGGSGESYSSGGGTGSAGAGDGQGFWSSLKSAFLPEEDSHAYEEGMRRGGYLLCAEVDEDEADRAISLLDETNSVDMDGRQDEWRSQGWAGFTGGTSSSAAGGMLGSGTRGGTDMSTRETGRTVEEERIPLVEEQLRVGKREVARGGARVRSYIQETPVHEQVNLREEHVSVERRAVDQTLERGALDRDSDMLRDRTIEMTETAEEAVVDKEARVREEVVVRKTAEEHVETIDDTVRRTEVDVESGDRGTGTGLGTGTGSEDRSAFGGFGGSADQGLGTRQSDSERQRETQGSGYDPTIDKTGL
jgi:uncharacterized protein (TIGR02271 family)